MNYLDYVENATHGTSDFPLAYYYVDETHPHYEMPFHWHHEMEICHMISGRFTFYLNGEKTQAGAGDTVFFNQGVIHGGTPDHCRYECLVFDPYPLLMHTDVCRSRMRSLLSEDTSIQSFFSSDRLPLLEITARLMLSARKKGPGHELSVLGALFEWFGYICETHSYQSASGRSAAPGSDKIHVLKPVLEYIEQSYMQPVTLEELARLSGMSPRYFCRFFRTIVRRTPIDYLNYYRIERACSLLASGRLSVTETAYRCGFNDSSYFVKIFRKYKGMTPKHYQRQYQ